MDPFSSEGELLNIHNAFHQGQYSEVIDFDISSFSESNKTAARVLQLRAQIAQGQAKVVLSSISQEPQAPDFTAIKALAQHASGDTDVALSSIERLADSDGDNPTVQVIGGIMLEKAGKQEEALALLSKHQGNLEATALITQMHLSQHHIPLALKEVQSARKWAQDSLLVNIAESWVAMRTGPSDKYQQAFYVFEEMAQTPTSSAAKSLVSQAVAEIHLGRLDEAAAALNEAAAKGEDSADGIEALANTSVLNILMGKSNKEIMETLRSKAPEHLLLLGEEEKSNLFDSAAKKYAPKVASS